MKAIGAIIAWPVLSLLIYFFINFGLSQFVDMGEFYLSLRNSFGLSAGLCVLKLVLSK